MAFQKIWKVVRGQLRNEIALSWHASLYDVAIKVLSKNSQPVLTSGDMLRVLARKPRQFDRSNICSLKNHPLNPNSASRFLEIIIGKLLQLPRTQESLIYDMLRGPADPPNSTNANITYSQNVLFLAAEVGNVDFIVRITKGYPQLLRQVNEKNQTIFHVAVIHRHWKIFGLLYTMGSAKDCIVSTVDSNGNIMLHLAGILNTRSKNIGAALQIQREILLFKEVGDMLPISLLEKRNDAHLTAGEEFERHHDHLIRDAEKWINDTSTQFLVIVTLLITILATSLVTFAGGYDQVKGSPTFVNHLMFKALCASNAITSLCAVSASSQLVIVQVIFEYHYPTSLWEVSC